MTTSKETDEKKAPTEQSQNKNTPRQLSPLPGYGGRQATRKPHQRPLYQLSIGLIDTYNAINSHYYAQKRKKKDQAPWDDENWDYKITPGDILSDRYVIKHRIGKGSFGQVVKCFDKETETEVAVKIIKSKRQFMVQAQTEITLLQELGQNPENTPMFVSMLHHFSFKNHQCIVFEMMHCNLYELLRNTNFKGVSLNLIRKFARQLLRALASLNSANVIHCDLKPENILLCHPRKSAIKVIDFGSACKRTQKLYTYIQSRFYRAPEVLLSNSYDCEIDMWSLGCVLVEMHTGEPLFAGKSSHDQLGKIIEVLGMPPKIMINRAPSKIRGAMFENIGEEDNYRLRPLQRSCVSVVPRGRRLSAILGRDVGGPGGRRRLEPGHGQSEYALFIDLLEKMLAYEPEKRINPVGALNHPFLSVSAIKHNAPTSSKPDEAQKKILSSSKSQRSDMNIDTSQARPKSAGA